MLMLDVLILVLYLDLDLIIVDLKVLMSNASYRLTWM